MTCCIEGSVPEFPTGRVLRGGDVGDDGDVVPVHAVAGPNRIAATIKPMSSGEPSTGAISGCERYCEWFAVELFENFLAPPVLENGC